MRNTAAGPTGVVTTFKQRSALCTYDGQGSKNNCSTVVQEVKEVKEDYKSLSLGT